MKSDDALGESRRPSRAVSLAVAAALVIAWGVIRLVVFETTVFPLTYAIPLLVCVWTRDRIALWSMAAVFAAFHTAKLFWILPAGTLAPAEAWANYGATLSNISVAAAAVHAIIRLRERLEGALRHVRAQADELRAQGAELAQQNEELATQAEELLTQSDSLAQQSEELARQNEELQSQAEEIATLNEALKRREALLQALLDTARLSGSERDALQQITGAAVDLFGNVAAAVAVYEEAAEGLCVRALATGRTAVEFDDRRVVRDDFVGLMLQQYRTASLNDASLRPDLSLVELPDRPPFRAALCAPVHFIGVTFGAFAVYSAHPHEWTHDEFRLAEWLAAQCGRVLQTLRVQSDLRDADRRKSEFLATLSHELRNPLTPIEFALRLIEAGNGQTEKAVVVLRRQLQQLVRLVNDLLDATRLTSNKIQVRRTRTDLVTIVRHAVDACMPDIQAAGHDIHVAAPPEPVWIDADADRICQVVTNLLNNATRYTPPGGRLALTVSTLDSDAVVSVADTGVGLDAGDLHRVFDMFTQIGGPGSGGLGIGLALVRGIVELHGGRVEARSDGPGRGSEFRVVLPLAASGSAETADTPVSALPDNHRLRVLVVDDNRDSAEMMGAVLEGHGHTIRVAHDAETALSAAVDFAPDAALIDIGLPGVDGYEIARRLRQAVGTRQVRLIALTGWGTDVDRARAREAGFDTHLTKPADPRLVLTAISADEKTA
ncbi:MAG TPA: ATP-binding protein [Vicinamibacterales bacterium]|nr:ATP-binding protein [Vicinamibacterales bacterium]